jgi:hypothetical protein
VRSKPADEREAIERAAKDHTHDTVLSGRGESVQITEKPDQIHMAKPLRSF